MLVKILTKDEIRTVVADLNSKAWSPDARLNRVLFYLATFAGLRASEICNLTLADVRTATSRPEIFVANGKGSKSRTVMLWHAELVDVLTAWKQCRAEQGALPADRLLVTRTGKGLTRQTARKRFLTACGSLGERKPTIHHGRHTFVSLSLAAGVPIAAVRDAAGHSSLAITNIYAHLLDSVRVTSLLG